MNHRRHIKSYSCCSGVPVWAAGGRSQRQLFGWSTRTSHWTDKPGPRPPSGIEQAPPPLSPPGPQLLSHTLAYLAKIGKDCLLRWQQCRQKIVYWLMHWQRISMPDYNGQLCRLYSVTEKKHDLFYIYGKCPSCLSFVTVRGKAVTFLILVSWDMYSI